MPNEKLPSIADGISTAGLALSLYGATEIGTTRGVLFFGAGRVLDLVDGAVARRTYSSIYGPKVDASFDKIAVAYGLYEAYEQDAVPELFLAMFAMHNIVNAVASVYTDRKGGEARTSIPGKRGMFGGLSAFGAFALGNSMGNNAWEAVGWGAFAASEPFAVKASIDYTRQAIQIRHKAKSDKIPASPKNHQHQKR